ncbi:MAG: tetratricopeptide repeat protein [SAR324 cluster bacterium]|nr:tetratricopeptide repeat protein [SAR324 cluster bacterium]
MKQAFNRNQAGIQLYSSKQFKEAIQQFKGALEIFPQSQKQENLYFDIQLNLANSYQMNGDYNEAKALYEQLIEQNPGCQSQYYLELGNLIRRMDEKEVLNKLSNKLNKGQGPSIQIEGDDRLVLLAKGVLPKFPGIRLSITIRMLDSSGNNENTLKNLGSTGKFVPISQGDTSSVRHTLVYNKEFWSEATDSELKGNICHELMHKEWLDTGLESHFFNWQTDSINYLALEWIMDLCVIAKGFSEDLYNSKKYILAKQTDQEHYLCNDISLNVLHLSRIFERSSAFSMPGTANPIPNHVIPGSIAKEIKKLKKKSPYY